VHPWHAFDLASDVDCAASAAVIGEYIMPV
jgi:hypothetical protein